MLQLLRTGGLIPHTTPEGCGDRWTFILNVLISDFILSTVSLWRRPAARMCVCVFSASRPLNKVSVGVRRQNVPGMQLSASPQRALWDCWSRCQRDQREQQSSIWPCLLCGGGPQEMKKKLCWQDNVARDSEGFSAKTNTRMTGAHCVQHCKISPE